MNVVFSQHKQAKLLSETTLQWCHNGHGGMSNHQHQDCLLNRFSGSDQRKHQSSASLAFVRGDFSAQMSSNAENVFIWWRHPEKTIYAFTVAHVWKTWCKHTA